MIKHVLLLTPVYVTLFWAVVLVSGDFRKSSPRSFLGFFMAVSFVLYLSHLFYFLPEPRIYKYLDVFYMLAYLLVYPMFHIYVRLLTEDKGFSLNKHGKFLVVPFVIFLLYVAGQLAMFNPETVANIAGSKAGFFSPLRANVFLHWVYSVSRVIFVVQVVLYLLWNYRLLLRHKTRAFNFFSNPEEFSLGWVKYLNICMSASSIAGIILAIVGRDAFVVNLLPLAIASVVFSAMLFFLGILGLRQKAVVVRPEDEAYFEHENDQLLSLKPRMDELFEKEKIFLNPGLKIWDLSAMLGTNRTYASRLINKVYNRNFCTHVNHYRLQHARQLIDNQPDLSKEQVADLSGFGSVNSLYRAFNTHNATSLKQLKQTVK